MTRFRILFVDDEAETREKWGREINAAGYDVELCASFKDARELLRNPQKFDMAVLDLHLTGLEDRLGLDLAKKIDGHIPIVMLSSIMKVRDAVEAISLTSKGKMPVKVLEKSDGVERLIELIAEMVVHRVFVVHGHDDGAKNDVVFCLSALGVQPIVLRDTPLGGRTIAESIEDYSNVSYAVVILTPDDWGEKRNKQPGKARARQNVILEWGFFIGQLGRGRVCALHKEEDGFEFPSDYQGVRYIALDSEGLWRRKLAGELQSAAIPIDATKVGIG